MSDEDLTRTLTDGGVPLSDDLSPGEKVGRYELLHRLGQGGAGIVWAARDPLVGDEVAVKLVPWLEPRAMRQYRRELATLLVLQIPGVVQIRDEGEHGTFVYVVTSRIHGEPFSSLAAVNRNPKSWMPSVLALLDILARVHLAGVTHADLKPSNILVDDQGRPTVLDFGLARGRAGLVHDGVVEGTPRYMAPEQRRGEPVTPRTDLYAVGAMLLEMITGTPVPFPPDLKDLDGRPLPRGLDSQIRRMLEPDPADRPASAVEVLWALDVDPVPDPVRWLGEGPWSVRQLEDLFDDVSESLQHLAEDGARLLFDAGQGDPARTVEVLRRWVRAGDVRWTEEGRIEVTRQELERLGARGSEAPEVRLAERLASGVPEAEVTAEALQLADAFEAASRPGRALNVLDAAALWVRGQPEEAVVLQRRVTLRLGRWEARAIDEASGMVAVSHVAPELRADLTVLLRGFRAALAGAAEEAQDIFANPSSRVSPAVHQWGYAMWAFAARQLPVDAHRAVIEAARADHKVERTFVDRLNANLAYRIGDYQEAAHSAERAAEGAPNATRSAEQWAIGAASWLEVGDFERARELALRSRQAARQSRNAVVEFEARWLLRMIDYRAEVELTPSLRFVAAAARIGARLQGMAAFVEAAIAWRSGHTLAGALAQRAATELATRQPGLALLCEALCRLHGRPARASAELGSAARALPPDLEVQVLALLHLDQPNATLQARGEALLDMLQDQPRDRRLDLLSLAECREAILTAGH
ncbi:MAG: serine/threonine-protein kinase [Myxococcota bacterium]